MRGSATRLRRREILAAGVMLVLLTAGFAFLPARYRFHLASVGGLHPGAHMVVFAAMGFLIFRGTRSYRAHVLSAMLLVLFAIGTEAGEHFLYRSTLEYDDIVANFTGIAIGVGAALGFRKRRARQLHATWR